MSLDFSLIDDKEKIIFCANITHNLAAMAKEAKIWRYLWKYKRGEKAKDLIPSLDKGLKRLWKNPEHFEQFNPSNGWGNYEGLVAFLIKVLAACYQYPNTIVEKSV